MFDLVFLSVVGIEELLKKQRNKDLFKSPSNSFLGCSAYGQTATCPAVNGTSIDFSLCVVRLGSSSVRFADTVALGNPQAGWLSLLSVSLALRRKATELWSQSPTTCSLSLLVSASDLSLELPQDLCARSSLNAFFSKDFDISATLSSFVSSSERPAVI